MRSANLASTVVSFLLVAAVAAQNQTEASSTTKSEKVDSTISSDESKDSPTSTTSESSSTAEETCKCKIKPDTFEWNWPQVNLTEVLVAKVIVKVDRTTNESTTITSYIKEDATDIAQNPEDVWNLALSTTGITMENGQPVYTMTRSIYTAVDKEDFFTTTQVLTGPSGIMDYGYRAFVTDGAEFETITSPALETKITSCAAEQTTKTIALSPADGDYKVVVKESEWAGMLPKVYQSRCEREVQAPIGNVNIQSALTETTTEYDDYQQSQVTTSSKKPDPTTPASTKATTTKEATKEPVKETSQNPPPSSQQPTQNQPTQNQPTQNQPTQNQPTQNEGGQTQPSQNQPANNSPAPPASSFTSTQTQVQTSTYTPVILGGATLTAGGPAATVSGTTYSLGSSSQLVVNGNTLTSASTSGGEGGLGTLIWEGLGGTVVTASQTGPVTATSTTVATFTGAASRLSGWVPQAMAVAVAGALFQIL